MLCHCTWEYGSLGEEDEGPTSLERVGYCGEQMEPVCRAGAAPVPSSDAAVTVLQLGDMAPAGIS